MDRVKPAWVFSSTGITDGKDRIFAKPHVLRAEGSEAACHKAKEKGGGQSTAPFSSSNPDRFKS